MEKISFFSEGHKLSGYVRIPKNGKSKVPGIVCCHGYSGMIEMYMQDIAASLTEAGYATVIFYHRGLGESEGPRGRVIAREQVEDIRNAMTYLQTLPEVDKDRIGLYGTCMGGSNVVAAAAIDPRAKCVVSTVGTGSGERFIKNLRRGYEWIELRREIEKDRLERVKTGQSKAIRYADILLYGPSYPVNGHGKLAQNFQEKYGVTGYSLESLDSLLDHKPEMMVDRIGPRPILFIHTGDDEIAPTEESRILYEKAKEPKKLVIIDGYGHGDVYKYRNPAIFEKVMAEAVDWYKKHLPV
jgi:uncharacterized protein